MEYYGSPGYTGYFDTFEGASQNVRLENKGSFYGPPDMAAAYNLIRLWNRSHSLLRNNGPANTAKKRLQANWIGTGIRVRWSTRKMQKLWDAFCENPCLDGYGDMVNLQELVAGAFFESGEVFCRMVIRRTPESKIPLKLQPIEAEYLDPLYTLPVEHLRYGITFDEDKKPKIYHFFKNHPRELFALNVMMGRVKIPANEVLHVFQRTRPGQWRGVPALTAIMITLYEMDELSDAVLVRQKAAQAIGWIITKKEQGPLPAFGPVSTAQQPDVQPDGTMTQRKLQKVRPGGIHYLQSDEEFTFAETDDIGDNLLIMLKHQWRVIASALDLTYEQLTGDLSDVNFSSIRAGMIEFRRRCEMVQRLIFINLFLKPLAIRFQELAQLYDADAAKNATFKFVLPKVDWVDPLKDVMADVMEIRAGLSTLKAKLEERGEDYDEVLSQLALEQGIDLALDTNPAKVDKMGKDQLDAAGAGTDPTGTASQKKKTEPKSKKAAK